MKPYLLDNAKTRSTHGVQSRLTPKVSGAGAPKVRRAPTQAIKCRRHGLCWRPLDRPVRLGSACIRYKFFGEILCMAYRKAATITLLDC